MNGSQGAPVPADELCEVFIGAEVDGHLHVPESVDPLHTGAPAAGLLPDPASVDPPAGLS